LEVGSSSVSTTASKQYYVPYFLTLL
jgi:hypothetical protein